MSVVITTPEGIEFARLLALRGRLRLETKGMRFNGRSTLTILQSEGIVKSKTRKGAVAELNAIIDEIKGE